MKRFFAFTLAETLIVMGIIGIVSALTLPNLNASTGEKEKVAKVKKIYQNLTDAFGRAQAVYGPYDEWIQASDSTHVSQSTRFAERITEFMKVSKTCSLLATNNECISNILKDLSSGGTILTGDDSYKFITADGTSIAIKMDVLKIYVDIDGPNKGTGVFGRDAFTFIIDKENDTIRVENSVPTITSVLTTGAGAPVTTWVIMFDNMDYLKTDSSGKCPNGKVLNALANPPVITCK